MVEEHVRTATDHQDTLPACGVPPPIATFPLGPTKQQAPAPRHPGAGPTGKGDPGEGGKDDSNPPEPARSDFGEKTVANMNFSTQAGHSPSRQRTRLKRET